MKNELSTPEMFIAYISDLPPSTNEIYVPLGNRQVLSAKARAYKTFAFEELKKSGPPLIPKNTPLRLHITLNIPNLENKGWPSKAKTRFKRRDTSNMVKLLEDTLATYLDVDDSNNIEVYIIRVNADTPGVHLWVKTLPDYGK